MSQPHKKKLIEVAIPLEAINAASAREKSIRHGHPSTLHLWWARRPLAACRAVLFAQLVDDPSSHPDKFPSEEAVETERKRLFNIIEELVKWENSTNEEVLDRARKEIRNSCNGELPPVYDPFSGGCSIPLEGQRLGLPAYGSDLNPVAVMIGKAMVEIPPKYKDKAPINPGIRERSFYRNAEGLAEDVKYYGAWMRDEALKQLGHLYPEIELPKKYGGGSAIAIAWLWTRTIPCPDPAFSHVQTPLVRSFEVSGKKSNRAWVDINVNGDEYEFITINERIDGTHKPKDGNVSRQGATCLISGAAMPFAYIREMASKGMLRQKLMAIVVDGPKGRIYLPPSPEMEKLAINLDSKERETLPICHWPGRTNVVEYGMKDFASLFTERQFITLEILSQIASKVPKKVQADVGHSATTLEYANAICVYLSFLVGQIANHSSTVCGWNSPNQQMRSTFSRQALPMTWDFAEVNIFSNSSGSFNSLFSRMIKGFETLGTNTDNLSQIIQLEAQSVNYPTNVVVSTDPPYYDNISYADLSDFFYYWMRKSLHDIEPNLFSFLATPKNDELIAQPYRQGGKNEAEAFFLHGMQHVIQRIYEHTNSEVPVTIYYAFKQSEISQEGVSSTGWATFLQAIITSGFMVVGTWPLRTEKPGRMISVGSNALANSVVLVCRKKVELAESATRLEFIRELKKELPSAIRNLQAANISPADMPQAAIGPGIGIFSKYQNVLEANDELMTAKTALQLINSVLDEFLNDLHGDFEPETRFTVTWFEQNGFSNGDFGPADNLARARGITVETVKHAGIIESSAGKVRILERKELSQDWDPNTDNHLTIWECCQYLVREYEENGELAAATLIKKMGFDKAETVKDLAYYLYDVCANKRQDAREATTYNGLIAVWSDLTRLASTIHDTDTDRQAAMDF